uniref:FAD-dependent monooxygenase n=1 Tax=Streptomyces tailanensis TaxID=2569858 RepID=UPI00122E16B5
ATELASRILPQPETERLLTELLHALGGKVERGVRLLCLEGTDFSGRIDGTDAVTAVLEHTDGAIERFRAPFVIGADGAASAVRSQIGVGFEGVTYEMAFALMDAHIEGELPHSEVRYYQAPAGTLVVVPAPHGVFRFLSVMPPGGRQEVDTAMMQAVLDERGPRGIRITEPVWQTVFRVHARHATSFQLGRVFLMGDAAHVHSPAGGQGMNTGLQDAANLAWKLAAVLRGDSPFSLLSGYGPERIEATRRIVRDTDLQTRAWMAGSRPRVLLRDTAFRLLDRTGVASRAYAPVMAGRRLTYTPARASQSPSGMPECRFRGTLLSGSRVGAVFPRSLAVAHDISGPRADPHGWSLAVLAPEADPGWLAEVGHILDRRPQVRLVKLELRAAAAATGCRKPGYHLIRPDGHIAAHGHENDLNRLEAELRHALTSRAPTSARPTGDGA